ncbi:MAG TPA: S8 family serine peptidase [Thermoanaerobaculia bacterium]|jgi:serine protease AprX|nr:S8 family serine peptidase [Thermoanaerobaculia bacterium]
MNLRIRSIVATGLILLFATALHAQILDPGLQSRLHGTAFLSGEPLRVIVTLDHVPTLLDRTILGAVSSRVQILQSLPMALIETTPLGVNQLLGRAGIRSLYLDKQLRYFMHESVPLTGAPQVWSSLGFDGTGVTVAVIDSGIDGLHPDLAGGKLKQNVKIVGSPLTSPSLVHVLENLPNSDTTSGHGTHCAGTVAGTGSASSGYYRGVAPGANLVGLGTGDAIFVFYALQGFDYVISKRNQYGIKVISNSWGTEGTFDADDPVNVASKAAHDVGMTVVFAAGNAGPDNNTLNPYSVAPWVIGVAAGNKDGVKLADFSSRGIPDDTLYQPTITAPGAGIVSTRSLNTVLPVLGAIDDVNIQPSWIPYYTTMSGTSMATPHIAGICALMYDANPSVTPDQIRSALTSTATPMPGYSAHEVGAGYVNAYAAVQAVQ